MTVTAPPRPPRPSDPVDREELEALVEALIEEARQRAHVAAVASTRLSAALVALVVVAARRVVDRATQPDTASPALAASIRWSGRSGEPKIAYISEPPRGGYAASLGHEPDGSGQPKGGPRLWGDALVARWAEDRFTARDQTSMPSDLRHERGREREAEADERPGGKAFLPGRPTDRRSRSPRWRRG